MGGFNLQTKNPNGTTGCKRSTHSTVVGQDVVDYIPHHNWFQYNASTSNPKHAAPQFDGGDRLYLRKRRQDARSGQPRIRSAGFL